jgi:hypothetical protein
MFTHELHKTRTELQSTDRYGAFATGSRDVRKCCALPHSRSDALGTAITLDVGGLTLTYNKNHVGWNHGMLFQERDRQHLRSAQINYEWFAEHQEDPRRAFVAICVHEGTPSD